MGELITKAFGVLEYQIGWPKWIPHFLSTTPKADRDTRWYTISATFPPATTNQDLKSMVQSMLRERFHLVTHHETRELPLYEVTIGSKGIFMKESPLRNAVAGVAEDDEHFESVRHGQTMYFGEFGMHYEGDYTIALLSADLSGYIPYRMVDRTGMSKYYVVDFYWSWNPYSGARDNLELPNKADGSYVKELIATMNNKLGLSVELHNVPTDVILIDQLDRVPTEN